MESNRYDAILIFPKTGIDFGATVAPPHSLLTISAPALKAGYKIKIIDQRINNLWEKELSELLHDDILCVGMSVMTGAPIYYSLKAAKIVKSYKNGKIPVVWGGPHPTLLPEMTLANENIDIICIGEADVTFTELLDALRHKKNYSKMLGIAYKDGKNIIRNNDRPFIDVNDLLPVPWEIINVENYIHKDFYIRNTYRSLDIGQTSRGCPYKCGFCSSAVLRKRQWRAMSVERSLEAILEPVKRFNLDSIWIRDDEFYIDRDRATEICEGIIKSDCKIKWYTSGTRVNIFNKATDYQLNTMKRSGSDTLKFGAESGSNRILKLMNKGITAEETIQANLRAKKHGITPAYSFMIGFPTQTFDEINETIDLMYRLRKENPQAQLETLAIYTALPGTELWDLAVEYGLKPPTTLEGWEDWLFHEYDIKGDRIPWFNYKDRIKIGNISLMSILAFAFTNAINSLYNRYVRMLFKAVIIPASIFYRFKLKHKMYKFAPELKIVNYLRRIIFSKGKIIFR